MSSVTIATPIGKMLASANDNGVYSLDFVDDDTQNTQSDNPHLVLLKMQLEEYFEGKLQKFSIPLAPIGTPFQMGVWDTLCLIPYGKTVSYAEEAAMLGRPTAVRAVANANGKNPIGIIIPCHRVIASGGSIGGYSGGLWRKEFLLELEKRNI